MNNENPFNYPPTPLDDSGTTSVARTVETPAVASAKMRPPSQPINAWRRGKHLVMREGSGLCDYCCKCNTPVGAARWERSMYWHHPALYVLIPAGLLIYAIVGLLARRHALVHIGLCKDHRRKRTIHNAIGWCLCLVGIGLTVVALVVSMGMIAIVGLAFIVVSPFYALFAAPGIAPKHIDDDWVTISGCGSEYLANYPRWSRCTRACR